MSVLVSLDDEVSVFDPDVLGSVGVDLHFVVPTAKSVYLHSPLGVVEGGTVEFVGPDELPVRGLGGMSRLEEAKQMERSGGCAKVEGFERCHYRIIFWFEVSHSAG